VVPAGSALAEQVVDGVTGLVAASSGAEQVADALRPLIVDATLRRRLSRGARELMLTRPTWDDVFIGLARDHDEIVEADDSVGRLLLRHPIESAVL
jgi:hypothetical protein